MLSQVIQIALSPEDQIARCLGPAIEKWGEGQAPGSYVPGRISGETRVRAALAKLDAVIAGLGDRSGARADTARESLTGQHDTLCAALDAFESLGVTLDKSLGAPGHYVFAGPAGLDMLAKQRAAREAVASAERAFEDADPDAILEARNAVDRAEATQRKANRELGALADAIAFPSLPNLEVFATAAEQTRMLVNAANVLQRKATTLHEALDQGRDTSDEVARLWICFEPKTKAQAFDLRWERYCERSGVVAQSTRETKTDERASVNEAAAS